MEKYEGQTISTSFSQDFAQRIYGEVKLGHQALKSVRKGIFVLYVGNEVPGEVKWWETLRRKHFLVRERERERESEG